MTKNKSVPYRTRAKCTSGYFKNRSNRATRSIVGVNAASLIRPLRESLDRVRQSDPDLADPHQYGYGMVELETSRVFRRITSDGKLHQIHLVSGDEIDGILAYIVEADGTGVIYPGSYSPGGSGGFPGNIDDSGENDQVGTITSGRFSGTEDGTKDNNGSLIRLFDGNQTEADPDLLADIDSLGIDFVGKGLTYIWSRFTFEEGRFNGDPNIKVYARSRKVLDPRKFNTTFDDSPKTFTTNPYSFIFDYLLRPVDRGGAGLDPEFVSTESFIDSARWSETQVTTQQYTHKAIFTEDSNKNKGVPPIHTNHLLEFNTPVCPFQYGDVVNINVGEGQALPGNLTRNRDYFVVPIRPLISSFQLPAIALAETLENSYAGITVPTGTRYSDINVSKVKEIRFQSGSTYRAGEQILERMLESCGANLYLRNGKVTITSLRFPAEGDIERVSLDELIGPIALTTSIDPAERATSLSGSFRGLTNLFVPKQYPTVDGGGVFAAKDGAVTLGEFNLPFVSKASVAQRVATINLRRRRQELGVALSGDLSLYRLRPDTIFSVDFPKYGLDENTTFQVREQTLFLRVNDQVPFLGVDVEGKQLESDTFALQLNNERFQAEAQIPGLDSPFNVSPPGSVTVTEDLFQTRLGAGVRARAIISWTASTSNFVAEYEVSLRRVNSDEGFFVLTRVPATDLVARSDDLRPDFYDVRVVAINSVGRRSNDDVVQVRNFHLQGLGARPSAPVNFKGQVLGAATVLLRWTRSEDLDVREGGFIEVRHSSLISGADAKDSTLLDSDVGAQTSLTVPFRQGTYFLRFQDSTGQFSDTAEWSTQSRRPVAIAQVPAGVGNALDDSNTDPLVFTIQEDPTFGSANIENMVVISSQLQLATQDTFDDEADVDLIADVDAVGGGNVEPEGTYFFSTAVEIDTPTRVLVEAVLQSEVFDLSTSIDVEDDFDEITDVDQVGGVLLTPGLATADIEVRFSNGTIASDTFGPWETIDTQFIDAKSFEFRVVAKSTSPTVNIRINQARIRMRVAPL